MTRHERASLLVAWTVSRLGVEFRIERAPHKFSHAHATSAGDVRETRSCRIRERDLHSHRKLGVRDTWPSAFFHGASLLGAWTVPLLGSKRGVERSPDD